MPGPGFEPGLLRPQRSVLTTRRSRLATEEVYKRVFALKPFVAGVFHYCTGTLSVAVLQINGPGL